MKSKEQLKRIKNGHDCLDCCSMEEWDRVYKVWKAKVLKENMKKKMPKRLEKIYLNSTTRNVIEGDLDFLNKKKRISKRGKKAVKKLKSNSFGLVARLI